MCFSIVYRYQGNEGRVPATNLTQADTLKMSRVTSHVTAPPVEVIPNLMSISTFNRQKLDRLVSATSSKEGRGDRLRSNPESPTKPLIDLNFDTQPSSAEREQSRQGIDENFNPLLRNSRRKCPPPRRNSVSTVSMCSLSYNGIFTRLYGNCRFLTLFSIP